MATKRTVSLLETPDSPTRTAAPESARRPFGDMALRWQVARLERLTSRSPWWTECAREALAESEGVPALVAAALDPCAADADIGARLRELISDYLQSVAHVRGDDLWELSR